MQHAFSRAYINFKQFEDVAVFRNAFDGYIFNAGKGLVIFVHSCDITDFSKFFISLSIYSSFQTYGLIL